MMNLRFQQDTLSGVISAATKEAKAIIEAHLPAIKEALQQQNTIVQNIEVEVRPELEQEHQSAFAEQFTDQKENDSEDMSTENIFGLHLNNEQPAIEIVDPLKSMVNPNGDLAYYA
jgi:flagellar hook-length control protein FliK